MENYKKLNNIIGWIVFLIATTVYFLTLEPTASWWDCGEYIATAYKLQVGHPPGAPFFQLVGRFFSLFAFGDTSRVALMINAMSALCSSFTILFLFWTITMLAKKIVVKNNAWTRGNIYAVLGSGAVGALAYTFTDSFWFSAVEGEVYAMSSLFTAVVFWSILKWEASAEEKHSFRWVILIAFLIGLSIGVHLLNLLAIPAVAFVYYFKRYKASTRGVILTALLSFMILAILMYLIIPGIVRLAGNFELFFVNSIGLPFNSGTIIYFVILTGLIVWGLRYTRKHRKVVWNTIILALVFILIGYSSFFMLIIRSNANTPIDENSPRDAISLLSYLNREQYGDWPIVHGQYFNAPVVDYDDKSPVYVKDVKKGRYVITDKREGTVPVYDPRFTTIFPRMWSNQKPEHKEIYKQYMGRGEPIRVTKSDGTTEVITKPTFGDNLRFFFSYQVGHMYFRYFMWNFAGRQNDIESQGEPQHGNWISGIDFIDNARIGEQDGLPENRNNPAHNKFYFLPLILGLIGLFYHINVDKKDAFVVFLLFFMTGIAIVIYLNQYPYQPRERDYAYAGSFYAFAIWIGLGVLSLHNAIGKMIRNKTVVAIAVTVVSLILVPGVLARDGWDDHDRSGKYATRDFAINYLNSCDPNAILITNGDNDTFPLWYAQEVEGIRTDVRVVNYMLASGYWYVHQLMNKVYDSDPLPFTLTREQYNKGVNMYVPHIDRNIERHVELSEVIDFIAREDSRTKWPLQTGERINYLPTRNLKLTVDSAAVIRNGTVPPGMAGQIVPEITWRVRQNALYKNDLMFLDFLSSNNWKRPIYFANPSSMSRVLDVDEYCHMEGFVYKFMPVKATEFISGIGGVSIDRSYDILMNKCTFGNLYKPDVTVDRESYRNSRMPKQNFLRLAQGLVNEQKMDSAVAVLDTCLKYFPDEAVSFDVLMLPFTEVYYKAGAQEKANALVGKLSEIYTGNLEYYLSLDPEFVDDYYNSDIQQSFGILQRLSQIAKENGETELGSAIDSTLMEKVDMFR
ncbi:MAG: DUF2723 domain-containing protein [Bacteroidales bacterium]